MKSAMDMVGSMPPEQLAAMQRSMMGGGAFPGAPAPAVPATPAAPAASAAPAAARPPAAEEDGGVEGVVDANPGAPASEDAVGAAGGTGVPAGSSAGFPAGFPTGFSGAGFPGAPAAGMPGSMPDMGAMLQNPAMMEMMKSMMKNITPEQMASMSRMAGKEMSPGEVRAAWYPVLGRGLCSFACGPWNGVLDGQRTSAVFNQWLIMSCGGAAAGGGAGGAHARHVRCAD